MDEEITVDGMTFVVLYDANHNYIGAAQQGVNITNSPVVITFDTPISPVGDPPTIDFGAIYQAIKAKLPA